MIAKLPIAAAALLLGCGAAPSAEPAAPIAETPAIAPQPRPPPPLVALDAAACRSLRLQLGSTGGSLPHAVYEQAFPIAEPAVREAVCACPPREDGALIMVTTTPDVGAASARTYHPDAAVDACLAARLAGAPVPRWHLGTDCIRCGPKRYGVLRGSPPVDASPEDGIATITLPVFVRR